LAHAPFSALARVIDEESVARKVDGLLFDLGVSSPQLDEPQRGFSFSAEGPLDMRMNPERGQSAAQWLARASEREISAVISKFGEERHAKRIARAIARRRDEQPINTTTELADIVRGAVPRAPRPERIDPATRTFQALRIFINDELGELEKGLDAALDVLASGGRLAVISFHSLEDRIVKRFIRRQASGDPIYRGLPDVPPEALPKLRAVGKARRARAAEVAANPRARSAVLRVAERLA
jgi:16S rRNA (cytosine1402-N4)-methyltransferase